MAFSDVIKKVRWFFWWEKEDNFPDLPETTQNTESNQQSLQFVPWLDVIANEWQDTFFDKVWDFFNKDELSNALWDISDSLSIVSERSKIWWEVVTDKILSDLDDIKWRPSPTDVKSFSSIFADLISNSFWNNSKESEIISEKLYDISSAVWESKSYNSYVINESINWNNPVTEEVFNRFTNKVNPALNRIEESAKELNTEKNAAYRNIWEERLTWDIQDANSGWFNSLVLQYWNLWWSKIAQVRETQDLYTQELEEYWSVLDNMALNINTAIEKWLSQWKIDAMMTAYWAWKEIFEKQRDRWFELAKAKLEWDDIKEVVKKWMIESWEWKDQYEDQDRTFLVNAYLSVWWGDSDFFSAYDQLQTLNATNGSILSIWELWQWEISVWNIIWTAALPSSIAFNSLEWAWEIVLWNTLSFDEDLEWITKWNPMYFTMADSFENWPRSLSRKYLQWVLKNTPEAVALVTDIVFWWVWSANSVAAISRTQRLTNISTKLKNVWANQKYADRIAKWITRVFPTKTTAAARNVYRKYWAPLLNEAKIESTFNSIDPQIWSDLSESILAFWLWLWVAMEVWPSFVKWAVNWRWSFWNWFDQIVKASEQLEAAWQKWIDSYSLDAISQVWQAYNKMVKAVWNIDADTIVKEMIWSWMSNKAIVDNAIQRSIVDAELVKRHYMDQWDASKELYERISSESIDWNVQQQINEIDRAVKWSTSVKDMLREATWIDFFWATSKIRSEVQRATYKVAVPVQKAFWKTPTVNQLFTWDEVTKAIDSLKWTKYNITIDDFEEVWWKFRIKPEALWADKWIVKTAVDISDIAILWANERWFLDTLDIINLQSWEQVFDTAFIKNTNLYNNTESILSKILC